MQDTALWFLNSRVKILVSGRDGDDGMSVLKHWVPCGDSPPLHVHDTEDEVFHVLEGHLRMTRGDEVLEARAGDTVMMPKGVPHTYCAESEGGAKFLTVTTRHDFEEMVRAVSRPATAAGLPEPVLHPTPEQIEGLTRVCETHNIRFVGAPMQRQAAA